MVWLYVVWIRPSSATDLSRPSTVILSRVASRCTSRCCEERVPGLLEQRLQRVGVGGVAGLGALGLGHAQLVEQHHLQLLGRAEVDLLADHRVGVLRGLLDLRGELGLQRGQRVVVDGDAGASPGRRARPAAAAPARRAARCRRARPARRRARRPARPRADAATICARGPGRVGLLLAARAARAGRPRPRRSSTPQLAAQVAQRQIGRGRSCAARAATGRRPARCRWSARAASSRGRAARAAPTWRRARPWARPGRPATRPAPPRRPG